MVCSVCNQLVSWSPTSQKATIATGVMGTALLITGIALLCLQSSPGVLATALIITGTGLVGSDALYFAILDYKDSSLKSSQDSAFARLNDQQLLEMQQAIVSNDKGQFLTVLRLIIKNWDEKKDSQSQWTRDTLAKAFGINGRILNQLLFYIHNEFPELKPKSIIFTEKLKNAKFPIQGLSTNEIDKMIYGVQLAIN